MSEFRCRRCLSSGPSLAAAPVPGPDGKEILEAICAGCWGEWERREVMVINELRLNFMEPESLEILARAMREFLTLDAHPG